MTITYEWRGESENAALDALHAEGFGHPVQGADRTARLYGHSLGWVCSRHDGEFVGFVDVAWDGGAHAFLPDTVVAPAHRRAAVGSEPVAEAARGAGRPGAPGHGDFVDGPRPFHLDACGFRPKAAGPIPL